MIASLPFPESRLPPSDAEAPASRRRRISTTQQRTIDADIILRHPCGGKALLETLPHLFSVERDDARQRRNRLFHAVDDGAGDAFVDDLRHRAAAERQDRRAAGHGLDHGKAERLRPIDGKQQRLRLAEELRLLMLVDFADEFDAGAIEQRLDHRAEIGFVGAVDLGCDLQRNAERARNRDGAVGALLRRDAAEKSNVVAARPASGDAGRPAGRDKRSPRNSRSAPGGADRWRSRRAACRQSRDRAAAGRAGPGGHAGW